MTAAALVLCSLAVVPVLAVAGWPHVALVAGGLLLVGALKSAGLVGGAK